MSTSTSTSSKPLWSIPKPKRPPHGSALKGIIWALAFNFAILFTNGLQLLTYPLLLFQPTKKYYGSVTRFTKASFGQLTVLITERFAPTQFVVSAGEGMGEPADWEVRDERGRVVGVNLPDRGVWMANHQTLSDWLYLWSFAYFTKHHSSVFITLKDSLKWIPFVGWACQLFGFIFLSRKWVNDKGPFKKQLEVVAHGIEGASGDEKKLLLLIFPEGTLVTGNTRPLSKAFADKTGVTDLSHTLLPRSTGLFFALRSLAPLIPTLSLIDLTVGYPGPDASSSKWPEDYYDLTLWYKGLPPPSLHIHIRKWEVKTQVPLGTSEGEGTDAEKKVFEAWLRERWDEKDALMKRFVEEGSFVSSPLGDKFGNGKEAAVNGTSHKVSIPGYAAGRRDGEVSMPIRLRSAHENLGAFAYFLAPLLLWFVVPILFAGVVGVVSKIAGGSSGDAVKLMPDGSPCGCGKATTSAAAGRLGEL